MQHQITLKQYRNIDLLLLCGLLAFAEVLIYFGVSKWYPDQLYVLSPVAAITALVMMRWNVYAAIPAVFGGLLLAGLSGGTWQQFLIYGVGNGLSVLALLMFKILGKERIREDALLSMLFALCVQACMWLGRMIVAFLLGTPIAGCLGFITTDVLSGLFTVVIIWIVRRINGLFEDQIQYLLRMQSERQVEGRDQF